MEINQCSPNVADVKIECDKVVEELYLENFIYKVRYELQKQNDKWGPNRDKHPLAWNSILIEEVGEVSKEMNDNSFSDTLPENYETELIQVAACAFRMFQQNQRNKYIEYQKSLEEIPNQLPNEF